MGSWAVHKKLYVMVCSTAHAFIEYQLTATHLVFSILMQLFLLISLWFIFMIHIHHVKNIKTSVDNNTFSLEFFIKCNISSGQLQIANHLMFCHSAAIFTYQQINKELLFKIVHWIFQLSRRLVPWPDRPYLNFQIATFTNTMHSFGCCQIFYHFGV